MRAGLKPKPPINVEILDMIYRFENGRIAEDWGIAIPALWP